MSVQQRSFLIQIVLGTFGIWLAFFGLFVFLNAISFGQSSSEILLSCEKFFIHLITGPSLILFLVGSLSVAIAMRALISSGKRLISTRRLINSLEIVDTGLRGSRKIYTYRDNNLNAFCTGYLKPAVFISDTAIEKLSTNELAAVIAHELHHADKKDPLRQLILHAIKDSLFFIPGLRCLFTAHQTQCEIAADAAALKQTQGNTKFLACALLKFDSANSNGGIDPNRVDHLGGDSIRFQVPWAVLLFSISLLSMIFVVISELVAGHGSGFVLRAPSEHLCMAVMFGCALSLSSWVLFCGLRFLSSRAKAQVA